MGLDIFQNVARDTLLDASRNIAPDLPATFSEAFSTALTTGHDWSASNAYSNARGAALDGYLQGLRDNFGATDLVNPYLAPTVDDFGRVVDPGGSLDELNGKVAGLAERYPNMGLKPLTADDVDRMTLDQMGRARGAAGAMSAREKTWGGSAGGILGSLTAGAPDPINIALLPLNALGGAGFVARAAEFAAIGAAGQVANEVVAGPTRERAVPGSLAEAPMNVLEAGAGGAALGGGFHVLGAAFGRLGRLLGIDPRALPTSVRDDLHAATSDAQASSTNIMPGVIGEAAHADALGTSVGQIARGERVTAADKMDPAAMQGFRDTIAPIMDARARLDDPQITFDSQAGAEVNAQVRSEIRDRLTAFAQAQGHDLPPETAGALADQIIGSSPAEAERILAEAMQRPVTIGERPDVMDVPIPPDATPAPSRPLPPDLLAAAARDGGCETIARLGADSTVSDAVLHDLDHIRAEQPEAVYRESVRQADGSDRIVERPLSEVMAELDAMESGARELEACLVGLGGAAAATGGGAVAAGITP